MSFTSGYLIGLLILFGLQRFISSKYYLFTLLDVLKLFLLFIAELFTSSMVVIGKILQPKINIKPGILSLDTSLQGDVEVTLLALLLTLTPGSVVIEISPDNKVLYVHAMDIPELSDGVRRSQIRFERAIKKVTRP